MPRKLPGCRSRQGCDIDLVSHPLTGVEEPDRVATGKISDINRTLAVSGPRIIRGSHVMVCHALAAAIKVLGFDDGRLRR